ncbi:hypothetical protein FKM82_016448 [Ascaphus truei]
MYYISVRLSGQFVNRGIVQKLETICWPTIIISIIWLSYSWRMQKGLYLSLRGQGTLTLLKYFCALDNFHFGQIHHSKRWANSLDTEQSIEFAENNSPSI